MHIRYEDLLTNGEVSLNDILTFIGLDINPVLIKKVYAFSQAKNMRKLEAAGKTSFSNDQTDTKVDDNSRFIRKAKSGGYKDDLSVEDLMYCNRLMENFPKIYGYFPN